MGRTLSKQFPSHPDITEDTMLMKALMGLALLIIIFPVTDFFVGKVIPKMKQKRTIRRLAELSNIQKRIREVESGLPLLALNVRSTANAEDYGSDPWRVRTNNRSAEIRSDRDLVDRLKEKEEELIRLLGRE